MTIAEQFMQEWNDESTNMSNCVKNAIERLEARLDTLEDVTQFMPRMPEPNQFNSADCTETVHPEQPKGAEWIAVPSNICWVRWSTGEITYEALQNLAVLVRGRRYPTHIRPYIPGEDKPEAPEVSHE